MSQPAVCCGKPCPVVWMARGPYSGELLCLLRWPEGAETWVGFQFVQLQAV